MHSYIALLGQNPTLSVSEIASLLPSSTMHGLEHGHLKFDDMSELAQEWFDGIGGTILLAKEVTSNAISLDDIPKIMAEELKNAKGKVSFGLRFHGIPTKKAQDLYRQCKDELKKRGVSSRYIGSAREPAKAVQHHDEGLLNPTKGVELVIIESRDGTTVYRTIAAQDIKKYSLRDMKKPVRDTTVGLLPPKLAQMMLNFGSYLAKPEKAKVFTVYDPFCGTGVIPMEAMLRGWSVLASDSAEKAVTGCKKNIEWTYKTFDISKKNVSAKVWRHDATKAFDLKEAPSIIVTEGTLGPALRGRPTLKDVSVLQKKVDAVMTAFVENAARTLPAVPIVMTLPVWYAQKKLVPLPKVWEAIEQHYIPVLPPMTEPMLPGRFSMLYRRPDQFVGREIVMLRPKK